MAHVVADGHVPDDIIVWLGGVTVGRRIRDQEVASSIPGCSASRCNSGQVVHTRASVHQAV